jgi:hypothetical protein
VSPEDITRYIEDSLAKACGSPIEPPRVTPELVESVATTVSDHLARRYHLESTGAPGVMAIPGRNATVEVAAYEANEDNATIAFDIVLSGPDAEAVAREWGMVTEPPLITIQLSGIKS